MTPIPFFCIVHKATGVFMPQMRHNRGYSHWNPASGRPDTDASLPIPRLLASEKQARRCIVQWASLPNARNAVSYDGEPDITVKPDGRKKEDLAVVPVLLAPRDKE